LVAGGGEQARAGLAGQARIVDHQHASAPRSRTSWALPAPEAVTPA
jgi:hypothetical protein